MYEKLIFESDNGEEEFYIIEQTRLNNIDYLLIVDAESDLDNDDSEVCAMIVKDVSKSEDLEAIYEVVEDEEELNSLSKIFDELLEDMNVE